MAKQQITVPDIGGAEGAEVIELLAAAGDEIAVDQSLLVLESDKASMEIPSTVAGTLVEMLVSVGEQLSEGAPVAVIEVEGDVGQVLSPVVEEAAVDTAPTVVENTEVTSAAVAAPAVEPKSSSEMVIVPDIGSDDPVELIEVCVSVGDTVAEGDSLVVLESDKASMEVPAPAAGEVLELRVNTGDTVKQGDDLLILRVQAGAVVAAAPVETTTPKSAEPVAAAPSPAAAPAATISSVVATEPQDGGSVYAGPAVRKLAREFGVQLQQVSGSGPRGRIVKEDLQQYVRTSLESGVASAPAGGAAIPAIPEVDYAKFGPVEVTQRSKLDKLTAANMQRSWLNVPHVTQFDDADITGLEEFRKGLKAEAERRGTRLTPMPFILKACAAALRDNPKFASSLAGNGEQLVYKKYIHIGMAVDTPAGLMVPVIRDVDRKTVWELAEEILAMANKARERKLMPADMQGGCFTVSSLGNIGGRGFTPIVNAPEVGILGVSRAATQPVWDGQAFVPRTLLPLALSYDHRVINGGDGGRFLSRLVAILGDIRELVM